MRKIKYTHYTILDFQYIEDKRVRLSLGILGFLFVLRGGKGGVSYIPTRFIQPLSNHSKTDLIDILIRGGYIQIYQRKKTQTPDIEDSIILITRSGKPLKYSDIKRGYKKEPKLYIVTNKLRGLRKIKLQDEGMSIWMDRHLHLLNEQYFNHYDHNYKHIRVNLPQEEERLLDIEDREIFDGYGHSEIKDYHIWPYGYDNNNWAGNHINLFQQHKHLIKYTDIKDPIEIGLLFDKLIIIADQMLKAFGPNDFSEFYFKKRYSPGPYKHFSPGLFTLLSEYDLTREIFVQKLYTAIYGWAYVEDFAKKFPQANNLLYKVKTGGRGLEPPFYGFTKGVKPTIFKTDYRIFLDKENPAHQRGQTYYKIVSLVYAQRINFMLRQVWKRLKSCNIRFIPLEASVVVSSEHAKPASYIFEEVIKKNIDNRIKTLLLKNSEF